MASPSFHRESIRHWAEVHFTDVWRTSAHSPGYTTLQFPGQTFSSQEFRRVMLELATAFGESLSTPLVIERLGRFDQQVSTRFHRDGAAEISLLILGYEPTTVSSRLFIHDPYRVMGTLSPFQHLQRNKPMTREGDEELMRNSVNVLGPPEFAQIVVLNNSAVLEHPPANHQLGVLHKGLIELPDPQAKRVINSMGLMLRGEPHREPIHDDRLAWFLDGETLD